MRSEMRVAQSGAYLIDHGTRSLVHGDHVGRADDDVHFDRA